jgi:DNA-directed RNA polymerase specialized sigma24 family protein
MDARIADQTGNDMDDALDDCQLLARYVTQRCQAAFAELVRRHIDLVYAACLRQTHHPTLAEDATQAVFLILAQRAATLPSTSILAGWVV